jgi:hypothetical protein
VGVVEQERRTSLAFPNEPSRRREILPEGTAYVMDGNRRCRRMVREDDGVEGAERNAAKCMQFESCGPGPQEVRPKVLRSFTVGVSGSLRQSGLCLDRLTVIIQMLPTYAPAIRTQYHSTLSGAKNSRVK